MDGPGNPAKARGLGSPRPCHARAYHVFSSPASGGGWAYYRENLLEAINFWNGGFRGLGIYGGLIGGFIAVILYTWRHKLNLWQVLDFIAPNCMPPPNLPAIIHNLEDGAVTIYYQCPEGCPELVDQLAELVDAYASCLRS